MQLFGSFTSPYVRHARLVVAQTGLDCEFIETDAQASAKASPTKKVPFLKDGDMTLTDSCSIIRYLREKAGQAFMAKVEDFDLFCLVNTLLDSCVNIFLLERGGLDTGEVGYLQRQSARVDSGLEYLNSLGEEKLKSDQDVYYRLMAFVAWGQYRNRFSIDGLDTLQAMLAEVSDDELFMSTQPPAQ